MAGLGISVLMLGLLSWQTEAARGLRIALTPRDPIMLSTMRVPLLSDASPILRASPAGNTSVSVAVALPDIVPSRQVVVETGEAADPSSLRRDLGETTTTDGPASKAIQSGLTAIGQIEPLPSTSPAVASDVTTSSVLKSQAAALGATATQVDDPSGGPASPSRDDALSAQCSLNDPPPTAPLSLATTTPEDFGRALAAAALRQTKQLVIYTDKYRQLAYPMGDVPALYGVCTDVVIRAYRELGIDLQEQVHAARIGPADSSIAHRRTFVLRRYFASRGASIPVTEFTEDYLAGDIVTYDKPQNRGTRDHIAIVTDIIAPSGRPMVVHNRGWGPQLEDALFSDRITGHYRYRGRAEPIAPLRLTRKVRAAALKAAALRQANRGGAGDTNASGQARSD